MTVEYKTYWSDEIPNQALEDFLQVENAVLYHAKCMLEFLAESISKIFMAHL